MSWHFFLLRYDLSSLSSFFFLLGHMPTNRASMAEATTGGGPDKLLWGIRLAASAAASTISHTIRSAANLRPKPFSRPFLQ
ncbi:MAG: hypothetical protein MI806_10100 [Minwuiales bacterium]|nr:hypothetical protein [Minwuiales bacterium]